MDPLSQQRCVPETEADEDIIPEDGPGGWGTTSDVTADSVPTENPMLTDGDLAIIAPNATTNTTVAEPMMAGAIVEEAAAAAEVATESSALTLGQSWPVAFSLIVLGTLVALVIYRSGRPVVATTVLQTASSTPSASTASL
jgi:hypothetical protein